MRRSIFMILCCLLGVACGDTLVPPPEIVQSIVLSLPKQQMLPAEQVERYTVNIRAADMSDVYVERSASTNSVIIRHVPVGVNRELIVRAFNRDGVPVREASANFDVQANTTTELSLQMQPLPIFTNLRDGAVVLSSRLRPVVRLAAEQDFSIEYWREDGGETLLLNDISLASTHLRSDANGYASVRAPALAAGTYYFALRDASGLRHHQVRLRILEATTPKIAPLWTTASSREQGCQRLGGFAGERVLQSLCMPN